MTDSNDPIYKDARSVQKSLRRSLNRCRASILMFIIFIAWSGISVFDSLQSSSYRHVAEDADSTKLELASAENYFDNYESRMLSASFLGPDSVEASQLRDQCRNQIAEKQWIEVLKENDPVRKGEVAEA